mmetsp:Transcript_42253/g.128192  ORF Transcript_42253/g.128192 Transcript_42253/m.128192 type:complete len:96 (+) Transcript_42253:765-1052(+)
MTASTAPLAIRSGAGSRPGREDDEVASRTETSDATQAVDTTSRRRMGPRRQRDEATAVRGLDSHHGTTIGAGAEPAPGKGGDAAGRGAHTRRRAQ